MDELAYGKRAVILPKDQVSRGLYLLIRGAVTLLDDRTRNSTQLNRGQVSNSILLTLTLR